MTKMTEATLIRKIEAGQIELEFEANRFGLAGIRYTRTGNRATIRVVS